jgi:heme/copper-type cytochrome/quinol oxidase subunit 2
MLKSRNIVWGGGTVLAAVLLAFTVSAKTPQVREVSVRGDSFAFSPANIEVQKDEVVKVTFTAVDMAHSFTIDEYRISKRAAQGQTVTFEFRADKAGAPFYCNLSHDERCKKMRGELRVR